MTPRKQLMTELDGADPTVNDALYALSQKGSPAECHVYADNGTTVTMTKGTTVLSAVASGGEAVLYPAELGDWSIQYTYGGTSKTRAYTLKLLALCMSISLNITALLGDSDSGLKMALLLRLGRPRIISHEEIRRAVERKRCELQGADYGLDHDQLTSGGIGRYHLPACSTIPQSNREHEQF